MHSPILIASLLALSAAPEDPVSPLLSHAWGRWQNGAWVESEMRKLGPELGVLLERDQLLRSDESGYVLKSTLKLQSGDQDSETEYDWALGGFAHLHPEAVQIGEEVLSIAGEEHACKVWQVDIRHNGQAVRERAWVAEGCELPLRIQVGDESSSAVLTVAKTEVFEVVGDRKLRCTLYEGTGSSNKQSIKMQRWVSTDVPGGMVRMRTELGAGAERQIIERRVVKYRGIPRRR